MKKFTTIILTCVAIVFSLIIVTNWANGDNNATVKNYSTPVESRLTQKAPFQERRERIMNGDKVKPVWQEQPSPPAELKVTGLAEENSVVIKPDNADKQSVVVVFHEDDLKRVIVISNSGQWIADAKELEISVGTNKDASLKCVMYKGSFRPSSPQIKEWNIGKILVATDSQFQAVIDSLNQGKLPTF